MDWLGFRRIIAEIYHEIHFKIKILHYETINNRFGEI